VREDGRIVGGEEWQEKLYNIEELKKWNILYYKGFLFSSFFSTESEPIK
jgi:hypothetical protein